MLLCFSPIPSEFSQFVSLTSVVVLTSVVAFDFSSFVVLTSVVILPVQIFLQARTSFVVLPQCLRESKAAAQNC